MRSRQRRRGTRGCLRGVKAAESADFLKNLFITEGFIFEVIAKYLKYVLIQDCSNNYQKLPRMRIRSQGLLSPQAGISLTELLLMIGVIAVIATIAIPMVSSLRNSAKKAAATQNAKNVAQMSEALAALGVAHVIPDSMGGAEATARLLQEGVVVPEGPMAGERFVLSGMGEKDIEETAEYLKIEYGSTYLRLVFSPPSTQQTGIQILKMDQSRMICGHGLSRSLVACLSVCRFPSYFLNLAL